MVVRWLAGVRGIAIDPLAIRESRQFRVLFVGQLVSTVGQQVTMVALPYQVYILSRSSLAVGLLGALQVVPYIVASVVAGPISDRFDRRRVLFATQVLLAASSAALMLEALQRHPSLAAIYAIAVVASGISAVDQPARTAIIPNIVSAGALTSAMSLNSSLKQLSRAAGPALGGLAIQWVGLPAAYGIDAATFGAALWAVMLLQPQRPLGQQAESFASHLAAGFMFLGRMPILLASFLLDLDAMILSLPRALFPALAVTVFRVGPIGLGILYATPGLGAVAGAAVSGFIGRLRKPGRAVLTSVTIWGMGIACFGLLTRSFWLALIPLFIAGSADAIGAISRATILQTLTPDRLRGRLSAVNSMVVTGGPYLGDLRAGILGSTLPLEWAVTLGGLLSVAGGVMIGWLLPDLWSYDRVDDPSVDARRRPKQRSHSPD